MAGLSRRAAAALAFAGLAAVPRPASPQEAWPNRPIRLVIPFTPAGTTDLVGRLAAERLSARLGQQVVVENRPGAGGNVGAEAVARAEPDGHTLLLTTIGTGAINCSPVVAANWRRSSRCSAVRRVGTCTWTIMC